MTGTHGRASPTPRCGPRPHPAVPSDPAAAAPALSGTEAICADSGMFRACFGSTLEQFSAAPDTKVLWCGSAADGKSWLFAAHDDGWRSFIVASDLHLIGNRTLGSATDPGTGTAVIPGAQISCAGCRNNGNGTVTQDPDALRTARRNAARTLRVPGSWRDCRRHTDARP